MMRDLVAALGLALMVAAIALWQPLVGLFTLGLTLVIVAVVASFVKAAAPGKESDDGTG